MRIRITIMTWGMAAVLAAVPVACPAQDDGLTESPDGPEAVRVYFTEDEALAKVFGKADTVESMPWVPSDAERVDIEARLGARLPEAEFPMWRARKGDEDQGWAVVLEEKGRFKPITFMVHVEPDRSVGYVLVMVYRESRGDGVKRQRFLKQFRGKDLDDHLRMNRDVIGLTGATMSSRALTHGVRKALVLVDVREGAAP